EDATERCNRRRTSGIQHFLQRRVDSGYWEAVLGGVSLGHRLVGLGDADNFDIALLSAFECPSDMSVSQSCDSHLQGLGEGLQGSHTQEEEGEGFDHLRIARPGSVAAC